MGLTQTEATLPEQETPATEPETDPEAPGEKKAERTFTQEEVNRYNTKAKRDGEKAATQKLADELGMSVEEAKALISATKERQEAEQTALEKAENAAKQREADAEAKAKAAELKEHNLNVKAALLEAGVPKGKLAKATRLLDAEVGASEEDIAAEVESLKEDWPEVFATASETTTGGAPSGMPSGKPGTSSVGESSAEREQRRAAQWLAENRGIRTDS